VAANLQTDVDEQKKLVVAQQQTLVAANVACEADKKAMRAAARKSKFKTVIITVGVTLAAVLIRSL